MKAAAPLLSCLAAAAPVFAAPAPIAVPVPVSPGAVDRVAGVEGRCPTFSWGPTAGAVAQELVIVEPGEAAMDVDSIAPLAAIELPGTASSWTPAVESCLVPDRTYAWSIRALGEDDRSVWSEPRLFRVLTPLAVAAGTLARQQWFGDHLPPDLAAPRSFEPVDRTADRALVPQGIFIEGLSVPAGQELQSVTINCNPGYLCGTGVYCGNGKVVLGGGVNLLPSTSGLVLWASHPDDLNPPPQMWLAWVQNTSGTQSSFDVHAICTTLAGAP